MIDEREYEEQCRIIGMSAERELFLRAENDRLRARVAELEGLIKSKAAEWKEYRETGYFPPEDGEARYYIESSVQECGGELLQGLAALEGK